jgi:uncharacterized protein
MMLLDEDVTRIKELGFDEDFFTLRTDDGFKVLKNSSAGRCVFHDGSKCTIYEDRPKGCKLYPVIYDENLMRAVKDTDCPYRNEFRISPRSKRELSYVYSHLIAEKSDIAEVKRKMTSTSESKR